MSMPSGSRDPPSSQLVPLDLLPAQRYEDACLEYLASCASIQQRLIDILNELDMDSHYSVEIDVLGLIEYSTGLGSVLLRSPARMLRIMDEQLVRIEDILRENHESRAFMSLKRNVHARVSRLPLCAEVTKPNVSSIRANDINRLISISGTVIRAGVVRMLERRKEYECKTCAHRFAVEATAETNFCPQMPTSCPSASDIPCKGTIFALIEGTQECCDYQELKVQEPVQSLTVGKIPRSITVVMENDLVDTCKPGDDVVVHGVLTRRWRSMSRESRPDVEVILEANHVTVNNGMRSVMQLSEETKEEIHEFWERNRDRPYAARNHIISSICPQLYGLYIVKLVTALTLIGGNSRKDRDGTKVRGELHCLMIGDPGTGKSQFLKYAMKLSHRAVMTTGIGSTNAGLTVAATKESGEWALEAGALVLADGGLCCIDEFDSIREGDKAAIHEAMEQQTISVAKAGMVCKLNTRTSVLACTNPKGRFDPEAPLSVNCAIATPLLSRFDFVIVLMDECNPEWDKRVSSFILDSAAADATNRQDALPESEHGRGGASLAAPGEVSSALDEPLWPLETLQRYIMHVRDTLHPILTPAAEQVLVRYYTLQRQAQGQASGRSTIRLLESLVRISQAHARLMFRQEVLLEDACMAVLALESSSLSSPLLHGAPAMREGFPEDPDAHMVQMRRLVLEHLGLPQLTDGAGAPPPGPRMHETAPLRAQHSSGPDGQPLHAAASQHDAAAGAFGARAPRAYPHASGADGPRPGDARSDTVAHYGAMPPQRASSGMAALSDILGVSSANGDAAADRAAGAASSSGAADGFVVTLQSEAEPGATVPGTFDGVDGANDDGIDDFADLDALCEEADAPLDRSDGGSGARRPPGVSRGRDPSSWRDFSGTRPGAGV